MSWSLLAEILGVTAFVLIAVQDLLRRIRWIFRPGYVLSRLDKSGAYPEAWFIFANPGPPSKTVHSASIEVSSEGIADWKKAVFIPRTASEVLTVVLPGHHVKCMNMYLAWLDGLPSLQQVGGSR
jgi:hypothetical protein